MQRLFNGASQQVLGTCRCPQCKPSTAGRAAARSFGKRATVSSPRPFVTSTIWLTTCFSTAMAIDGRMKTERREQWEKLLNAMDKDVKRHTKENDRRQKQVACVWEEEAIGSLEQQAPVDDVLEEADGLVTATFEDHGTRYKHFNDMYQPAGYVPFPEHAQEPEHVASSRRLVAPYARRLDTEVERPHSMVSAEDADGQTAVFHDELGMEDDLGVLETVTAEEESTTTSHYIPDTPSEPRAPRNILELQAGRKQAYLVDDTASLLDQVQTREPWPANTAGLDQQPFSGLLSPYVPLPVRQYTFTPKKTEIITISTNLLQLNILQRIFKSYRETELELSPLLQRTLAQFTYVEINQEQAALMADLRQVFVSSTDLHHYNRRQRVMPLAQWTWQHTGPEARPQATNDSLRAVFQDMKPGLRGRTKMLAQVYEVLNSSENAPDLHTYNTLIAGFSDAGMAQLTHNTIHTLRRSKLRPNDTTIATILQHYTRTGQKRYVNRWMRIIHGELGGLGLSHYDAVRENAKLADFLLQSEAEPEKVVRLQSPSPKIFAAIIAAALRFHGIDVALETCRSMGMQGWGLSMDAIGPLLRDCTRRGAVEQGQQMWTLVKRLESSTHDAAWPHGVQTPPAHVYAAMLHLMNKAGMKAEHDQILAEAKATHPDDFDETTLVSHKPVKTSWRPTSGILEGIASPDLGSAVNTGKQHDGSHVLASRGITRSELVAKDAYPASTEDVFEALPHDSNEQGQKTREMNTMARSESSTKTANDDPLGSQEINEVAGLSSGQIQQRALTTQAKNTSTWSRKILTRRETTLAAKELGVPKHLIGPGRRVHWPYFDYASQGREAVKRAEQGRRSSDEALLAVAAIHDTPTHDELPHNA